MGTTGRAAAASYYSYGEHTVVRCVCRVCVCVYVRLRKILVTKTKKET